MIKSQLAEFAKYDLSRLAVFLNASDAQTQTQAIEEAVQVNLLLADAAVSALQSGQDRYFVAERLPQFGSVVIAPLQALLTESTDDEVQILAALVLLRLGSKAGVTVLLHAVLTEPIDRYAALIVERLAANGIQEAGDAILARLRQFRRDAVDYGKPFESNASKDFVVTSLHALPGLDIALPPDLQVYFTAEIMPVEIAALLMSKTEGLLRSH